MIFSVLFKAILFYFLFVFIRGMWQTYWAYKRVKEQAEAANQRMSQETLQETPRRQSTSTGNPDVVEAEFRVLDENS